MKRKNPAAVALGKLGAAAGAAKAGRASAARLTPEERRDKARRAALKRWLMMPVEEAGFWRVAAAHGIRTAEAWEAYVSSLDGPGLIALRLELDGVSARAAAAGADKARRRQPATR